MELVQIPNENKVIGVAGTSFQYIIINIIIMIIDLLKEK